MNQQGGCDSRSPRPLTANGSRLCSRSSWSSCPTITQATTSLLRISRACLLAPQRRCHLRRRPRSWRTRSTESVWSGAFPSRATRTCWYSGTFDGPRLAVPVAWGATALAAEDARLSHLRSCPRVFEALLCHLGTLPGQCRSPPHVCICTVTLLCTSSEQSGSPYRDSITACGLRELAASGLNWHRGISAAVTKETLYIYISEPLPSSLSSLS